MSQLGNAGSAEALSEVDPAPPKTRFGLVVPLMALLGTLLLLLGLLSAWGIKRIDRDYSTLVTETALDLDRLHDISYHAGIGCATAIELSVTDDPAKRSSMLQAISDERWANDMVFSELLHKVTDLRLRASFEEVLARRAVFTNRTDEFIHHAAEQPAAARESARCVPVLNSFVEYQTACDKLADVIRARCMHAGSQLTQDAAKFRWLFFSAGALPILLGLAGILLTFYFVWVTPAESDFKE